MIRRAMAIAFALAGCAGPGVSGEAGARPVPTVSCADGGMTATGLGPAELSSIELMWMLPKQDGMVVVGSVEIDGEPVPHSTELTALPLDQMSVVVSFDAAARVTPGTAISAALSIPAVDTCGVTISGTEAASWP